MALVKFEAKRDAAKLRLYFKDLSEKILNAEEAMRQAALLVVGSVRKNFVVSGRPKKWKAIGPRWHGRGRKSKQKNRSANTGKPLLDTGRLFNSIRVLRVRKDSFEVGTNVPYAEIHQTGGKVPEKVFTNVKVRGFWVRRHKRKGVNVKRHYVRPFIKGRVVIKAHTIAARPYLMLQRRDKTNIVTLYSEKGLGLK